jgi:nicotinate-nucleotide adenylyltransferase
VSERLAIFGGTFDPIHYGHLAIAEEVRWTLATTRVLFVPTSQQPLKTSTHIATAAQRLEMARLAIADNSGFAVHDLEIRRGGRSYSFDTVVALQVEYRGAELFFVVGADLIADLPRWYAIDRLLALCRFVVMTRPGYQIDLDHLYTTLPSAQGRMQVIEGPALDISATALRERLASGAPVRYQIPDVVAAYIEDHGLYRPRA